MNYHLTEIPRAGTARSWVVANLAEEILSNPETKAFPIQSEHQLCRRFGVSRVTIRLALGDLEHRGLIFRKHGKGTFAHARPNQIHRSIAVLWKLPQPTDNRPVSEIIRGAFGVMASAKSVLVLSATSPEEWPPEFASTLGGVIVIAENVIADDLDNLKDRKLPFLIIGETDLPGPRVLLEQKEAASLLAGYRLGDSELMMPAVGLDFFGVGQQTAEILDHAALTGKPVADLNLQLTQHLDQGGSLIPPSKSCSSSERYCSLKSILPK